MVAEDRGVVAGDCAHAKLIDARKNSQSCLDDHASVISEAPAHLSIRPAHFLLPAFNHAIRKFMHGDARPPAGFRPHIQKGLIPLE